MKFTGIVILFLLMNASFAQRLQWAKGLIGTGVSTLTQLSPGANVCNGIAVDAEKNVYIAGSENDSVDFDPGSAEYYLQGGDDDIYFAKYDSIGQLLWAHVLPSAGWNYAIDLVLDDQANVYITGYCSSPADFDPSASVTQLPVNVSGSYAFIAKYSKDGNFIWAKDIGGIGGTLIHDLAIDPQNNIYITGDFADAIDCDPSPAQAIVTSNGSGIFFASYDENGNYIMAKSLSGTGNYGGASGLYVDDSNHIYLTGFFGGTVDFDPGSGTTTLSATSNAELFFAKYDQSGNFSWTRNIDAHGNVFAGGRMLRLTVNSQSTIYLTGQYFGIVDFNPGPDTNALNGGNYTSTFIAKYDSLGNYISAGSLDGGCFSTDILHDCSDNIYLAGDFGRADFDPGWNTYTMISNASSAFQIFFAKYDSALNFKWARQFGNDGYGGSINGRPKLVLDAEGNQFIGGNFKQTADFDPDSTAFTLTQGGVGMNSFFAKFSPSLSSDSISENIFCSPENSNFIFTDSSYADRITWNFGDQSAEVNGSNIWHHFIQPGTYTISLYLNTGCKTDTLTKEIIVPEGPQVNLSDQKLCIGEELHLNAEVNNGTYLWQNGLTTPSQIVNQPGMYWVRVTQNNCSATDTAVVDTMDCTISLIMPNVFTPNQDGKNDFFIPKEIRNVNSPELEIYNRWGNKLIESTDLHSGWNGKHNNELCSTGTYFWIIRYSDPEGRRLEQKGTVMLIAE